MTVKDPPLEVWQCPACTWFRVSHTASKWKSEIIDHPIYGRVTDEKVVELDTRNHNCAATRAARVRHGFDPNLEYTERYEQRTTHAKDR